MKSPLFMRSRLNINAPGEWRIHVPIGPREIRESRRKWVPLKLMYYLNNEAQAAMREISDEGAKGRRSGDRTAATF